MFDSLPETRGNGKLIASRSLSTAVLVHGLVIAAIVSAAFLARVDAGEDPPKPYELVRVIPLEIPRGTSLEAGGGGRPEKAPAPVPEKKEPEPPPTEPTQPVLVETLPAPVTEPAAPPSETPSPIGNDEAGGGGSGKAEEAAPALARASAEATNPEPRACRKAWESRRTTSTSSAAPWSLRS